MLNTTSQVSSQRNLKLGVFCLLGLVVFFIGQAVTQWATTAPYSVSRQAISELGITQCANFQQPQTGISFYVCSPLNWVMNGTFVVYGALIMLATTLAIRSLWPGRRMRNIGLVLLFFGGIEAVAAGFSPQDIQLFFHSLSGGLAIAALNFGLIFLGFAAIKTWRALGWFTLLCGLIGMIGLVMSGTPPYAGLGYGGWERVAGYSFAIWGIYMGIYWVLSLRRSNTL